MRLMRSKLLVNVVFLGIASGFSGSAFGDTATDTFQVTATVEDACVVSATNLTFGTYTPLSGDDLDGSTTVEVTCTDSTGYEIGLDPGLGGGATVASRIMSDGSGNDLVYTLYEDAGRTAVWGETLATDTVVDTGTGGAQNFTIYGQITGSQTVPPGSYSDTITVTVTF